MKTSMYTLLVFFLSSFLSYAQEEKPDVITGSVNEIGITVDSLPELKTLNWDELSSLFEFNKPQDSITVYVQLKQLDGNRPDMQAVSYSRLKVSVKGITEERDRLLETLRKRTDKLLAALEED